MAHGTDPLTADGDADPDGDGFNNRAEWLARTDPQNPASCFKFDRITAARNVVRMTFQANAGCTYSLVAAPSPGAGAWSTVCSVEAAPTNRVITLEQPCEGAVLYRLVTPKVASGP
jgi:hypothetical protein